MQNKKKILLRCVYAFLVVVVLSALYLFGYVPQYRGLINLPSQVLVFSHRGFGDHAPDNSLVGAQMAMKNGLDGVDMDAGFTSDKQLVIFHDLSVDRLTKDTGRVNSKTLKQMESLDLSVKFGQGLKGVYVKSFEDFVKEIPSNGILMTELKVPGAKKTGIEEEAARIIKKYNAYDKVYLSSFNPLVLYRLKKIDPKIHTVFIFMDTNWNPQLLAEIKPGDEVDLPWYLRNKYTRWAIIKLVEPDALSVNNEVDEGVIDKLISRHYPVFLWTVDDKSRVEWALSKQPYGIISNEPLLAKQLRDEM